MKKNNNKGFSLIELLVAVAILAIITIPLLRSFVVSANTGAKSRKLGDATLNAQNTIEVIKASDVGVLASDLKTDLNASSVTVAKYQSDGVTAFSGNVDEAPVLVYTISGINGSSMSAEATLDSTAYSEVNSRETADYTEMDAAFAQSRTEMEDPDQKAYNLYTNHVAAYSGTVPSGIERTITVKTWIDTDSKMYATVTYKYVFKFSYNEYDLSTGVTTTVNDTFENSESFSLFPQGKAVSSGNYPSIYLMYYPLYSSDSRWGNAPVTDQIIMDNQEDLIPYDLYLAKQKDPYLSDADLAVYEPTYAVNVIEQTDAAHTLPIVKLHTNVNYDLHTGSKLGTLVKYKLYSGIYREFTYSFDAKASGLVSGSPSQRMYSINVVMKDSSGNAITSMQAEKLN